MYLQRFYHEGLAQASYMVGCQETGEALIIDPNRDVDAYIGAAAAHGFRISHVAETHIHADFVSGSRDLARRTHARLLLSREGGKDWQYGFGHESGTTMLLRHDDVVNIGRVSVRALHTPGHTPEHLTFVVTDTLVSKHPMGAFTGDFIFVGDVGRPDLLERAAGIAGTMRDSARQLFDSLQRFAATHADHLQIWPGHGAGSACGRALGAVPSTTLGFEKLSNWAFQARDAESFATEALDSQSEPPPYFATMKRVNRDGPPDHSIAQPVPRQAAERLPALLDGDAFVIDLRPTMLFSRGGVPGTINLPLNNSFVARAGWLVPYDRDVYLLAGDDGETVAQSAVRELKLIGIDNVRGWFGADALQQGSARQTIPQLSVSDVATRVRSGSAIIVDVRDASEWSQGHIPGALHVPLGQLAQRAAGLADGGRQLVLHCATGGRSAVGASVLRAQGISNVVNMEGGYSAWQAAGLPVTMADA
ncbi:MAG TPA: MBL fold metallo-hydrolase [Gemmatimonadaceae bacterium]